MSTPQNLDLLGTKDITRMLGVTQAHCVGRVIKRPDFPKPAINLSQRMRKWHKSDVMRFLGLGK